MPTPQKNGLYSVYAEHPRLRAALVGIAPALGVQVVESDDGADLSLTDMGPGRVRLGTLMDWIVGHKDARDKMPKSIVFDGAVFDPRTRVFTRAGATPVPLTDRERDVVLALYNAPGQTLDRTALLRDVWGYVPGLETHTLETHIYRLRQKIETDPAAPTVITTTDGGYTLCVIK